jgi:hypothetical protein
VVVAAEPIKIYRGLSSAAPILAYTVPAGKKLVITSVVFTNKSASSKWAALEIGGFTLLHATPVPANGVVSVDCKQVANAGETVYVQGQDNTLNIHVSGVEIS